MKKNLKISIVTAYPTEGAGSGTLISAQAKTYVEMGHDVHIITANNNTKFKKLEGVTYHLVPFTAEKEPVEKINGALPFNFVMFTSHTNSSENFWNISLEQLKLYCDKFRKIFDDHVKEVNPDIFHGQHCWISTSLLCDYDIPVVCTIHGTDLMGYEKSQEMLAEINKKIDEGEFTPEIFAEKAKYEYYIHAAEKAARKSKSIFVISNQQKEKFEKLFPFAKQKVMLVRNGCDTTIFHTEKADEKEIISSLTSNITPDGKIPTDYDKLAIFVGKFAQFKRVDLVLKAAKIYEDKLAKEGKKITTLIVGSGALDEELRSLQKSLGLKNLHFVGRQPSNIVRKLYNISDVFLAPSDNEPDGLVYKEAMLCGNVPVGTLGGGVPDTLNPKNEKLSPVEGLKSKIYPTPYGTLIPMNDEQALADATIFVIDHPEKFDRNAIVKYALENYDQRNISKNVIIPEFEKVIRESKQK